MRLLAWAPCKLWCLAVTGQSMRGAAGITAAQSAGGGGSLIQLDRQGWKTDGRSYSTLSGRQSFPPVFRTLMKFICEKFQKEVGIWFKQSGLQLKIQPDSLYRQEGIWQWERKDSGASFQAGGNCSGKICKYKRRREGKKKCIKETSVTPWEAVSASGLWQHEDSGCPRGRKAMLHL